MRDEGVAKNKKLKQTAFKSWREGKNNGKEFRGRRRCVLSQNETVLLRAGKLKSGKREKQKVTKVNGGLYWRVLEQCAAAAEVDF